MATEMEGRKQRWIATEEHISPSRQYPGSQVIQQHLKEATRYNNCSTPDLTLPTQQSPLQNGKMQQPSLRMQSSPWNNTPLPSQVWTLRKAEGQVTEESRSSRNESGEATRESEDDTEHNIVHQKYRQVLPNRINKRRTLETVIGTNLEWT